MNEKEVEVKDIEITIQAEIPLDLEEFNAMRS